jgi:hypothetical protein
LGGYARSAWSGTLRDYLFLQPSISGDDDLVAIRVAIEWDDNLPGLALIQKSGKLSERNCPHERSSLIYIQPIDAAGRMLIVSTMLGEPSMRGLMLTVNSLVANAYVPVAVPILLRRLEEGEKITPGELGTINSLNPKFASYQSELRRILEKQFGRDSTIRAGRAAALATVKAPKQYLRSQPSRHRLTTEAQQYEYRAGLQAEARRGANLSARPSPSFAAFAGSPCRARHARSPEVCNRGLWQADRD